MTTIGEHKIVIMKLITHKKALQYALYSHLKHPDNCGTSYFEAAKQVYENNFSSDSIVQFYNITHNTAIQTSDIEKLIALQ